jgi:hypothetical protein
VIVSASGVIMSGVFLSSVIGALIEFGAFPPRFGSIVNACEVAAWRLKWVMLPIAIIVLWGGAWLNRSIKASPSKFIGLRAARLGFTASALVTVLIATLIGITVPVRLERRQWGIEAATNAPYYTFARAVLEYRERNGKVPPDSETLKSELRTLPDPDGSIAEALRFIDANGYQASTVIAAASTKANSLMPRGSVIRNASTIAAPATDRGVSFTSYELHLPGEDKIMNTDDDIIVRDGIVMKASDISSQSTTLARPNAP